ncbi:MAG: hypothetical protein K0R51_1083 [Cytophagaceae bacterium]|jgi:hypothetical protein|nr:hypothetical protein [Cytophagaceae bacterium]
MNYSFGKHTYFDKRESKEKVVPQLYLENAEEYGYYFIDEITNLSKDYLLKILDGLEKVLIGELSQYDFGYEVYTIECLRDISLVKDVTDNWSIVGEIATKDLHHLLKDWTNYISSFD